MSCDSHWEENVSLADGNKWRPMIFTVLDVTETRLCEGEAIDFGPQPPGYCFEFVKTPLSVGGVGLFINENYKYGVLERSTNSSYQALWIEILLPNNKKKNTCGIVYWQHNNADQFLDYFSDSLEYFSKQAKFTTYK